MKLTKKDMERISLLVIVVFAVFGSAVSSIAVHEYSHAKDYQEFAYDAEICALVLPESPRNLISTTQKAGYFSFNYNPEDLQEINKIDEYTETKAYSLSAAPIIILGIAILALIVAKTELK